MSKSLPSLLSTLKRSLKTLLLPFLFTLLSFYSTAQTVTTDKYDYSPGETAVLSGEGWANDSTVRITIDEEPAWDYGHQYYATVTDGKWELLFPIEERHIGVKFTVVVTGMQSLSTASTVFKDAVSTNTTITSSLNASTYGTVVKFTAKTTRNAGGGGAVNNVVGTLKIYIDGIEVSSGGITNGNNTLEYTTSAKELQAGTRVIEAKFTDPPVNNNYNPSDASLNQAVNKINLVGSFTAANKTYDGNTDAVVITRTLPSGVLSGDVVTLIGGDADFINKNAGINKTVTILGATLDGAAKNNYNLTSVNTTQANIIAKSLTGSFTADNKTYDGNTDAVVLTRTLPVGDIISGDVVTLNGGDADFDNKNAGTGKTVSLVGGVLDGAAKDNYSLSGVNTTSANILTKGLIGSFSASNKTYDGNTDATVISRTLPAGIIDDEQVILVGGEADFDNEDAGDNKIVTLVGAALGGDDKDNYHLSGVNTALANIDPKGLTGSFTADNKTYDGNTDAVVLTRTLPAGEIISGDVVTLIGGDADFDNRNAGSAKTVTLLGASLDGADKNNYSLSGVNTTQANIIAKGLTGSFTADNKTYDGNTDATVLTRTLPAGDIISGDVVTMTGGDADFDNKNAGTGKTVTLVGATLGGAGKDNYSLGGVNTTTANIIAKGLTGSFTADNKTYDGNTDATVLTRTLPAGEIVSGDVVSLIGGDADFDNKNAGTGKTVTLAGATLGGAAKDNYSLGGVNTTTANIIAKDLTGSFTADNKTYDGNTDAIVLTRTLPASDIISGDVVTLIGGDADFDNKNAGTGKTVTLVGATLGGAAKDNYSLSGVNTTTANITAKGLTGSFTASNKTYDGNTDAAVLTRTLPAGDIISGDVVSLIGGDADFDNKNAGTGKTVTLVGATLGGAGKDNYSLGGVNTTTANIIAKGLTGSFTADNKMYDGNTDATVLTRTLPTGEIISGDVVTLIGGDADFDNKNAGTGKTVTLAGATLGGAAKDNYSLVGVNTTTANIIAKGLTGSFTADNKTYDGNTDATVLTRTLPASDIISGDVVTLIGGDADFDNKNAGTGKTVTLVGATLGGAAKDNYSLGGVNTTTANIIAKGLTGSFTASNKTYDGNTDATVLTRTLPVANIISGDVVTLIGGDADFDNKNVGTGKTVTLVGATLDGAAKDNYSLSGVNTTNANILQLGITGSFTASNKEYDGGTNATVLSRDVIGEVVTDNISLTGGTANFDNKNVGVGKVVTLTGSTLSGTDAPNYILNSVSTASANITQRALVVSATGINKVYDGNNTATVNLSDNRLSLDVLTLSYTGALFNNENVGNNKPVSVSGISVTGLDAGNYSFNTTASTSANITADGICPNYNGMFFANTDAGLTSTKIRLSVVINTNGAGQDARTATVTFKLNGTNTNTAVIIDPSSTASQAIFYTEKIIDIGTSLSNSYDVTWTVGGNFSMRNDCSETVAQLTISSRSSDFLTGGGYIVEKGSPASGGTYAGQKDRKTNYGFNVKWNKSLTNIQGGGFTGMIRNGIYMYKIKASKVSTLTVTPRTLTTPATAAFTSGNATVTKINTETGVEESLGGNNNLLVEITDRCEPGAGATKSSDLIAITLRDGRNVVLLYTNNWNSSTNRTDKVEVSGGNIQINTTSQPPPSTCTAFANTSSASRVNPVQMQELNLKMSIYPNPAMSSFNLTFGSTKDKLTLKVMDVSGRTIQEHKVDPTGTFNFGGNLRPGLYMIQVQQGNASKVFKVIKL